MIDTEHPANADFSAEQKVALLRQMLRIRNFQRAALKYYNAGDMGGWLNLDIGQESIAAVARSVMADQDHGITGNRGIGHAIAAGLEMESCIAELMGKKNGCSKGKAGMFSFYQPSKNHWGCHGLAAAQTPLAAGLAFAVKQRAIKAAVVCFLGDGAVNQGVYHESLNLAGLMDLPVVYVIENNGFAMFTSVVRSSRFRECLARRAEGYGIDWDRADDTEIYQMRAMMATALERARSQCRPSVLEISTFRYYGASVADSNHRKYRSVEEINDRKINRDPLTLWRRHLIDLGILDEASAAKISRDAAQQAEDAAKRAIAADAPELTEISDGVYWETDHRTAASRIGRHFFND